MSQQAVVVITGASAGVGRATARAFAAEGARIGLIGRNEEALEAAKREVEARGGVATIAIADVADFDAVERATERIETALGPIDVWINNAMASVLGTVGDVTPAEYRRVMEVTFLGVVHGTKVALERMRHRNRGTIIQVGSTLAYRGIPLQSPYCAAKHAVQGFHDSLLAELHHEGSDVKVCMVNMPALNTPQFGWVRSHLSRRAKPFGTIFEPEVAARAIVLASKKPRRELNVGWGTSQAIIINAFVPGVLDRYLGRIGFDAQQSAEPEIPGRPDNLFETVPGDHGAHGSFTKEAKPVSPHLYAETHRGWIVAGAAVLILAAVAGKRSRRTREARRVSGID